MRAQERKASDLGFGLSHAAGDFKLGVAGFVVASIPVFVMQFVLSQLIPYKHPVGDIFQAQPSLAMIVAITAILAVVIAPSYGKSFSSASFCRDGSNRWTPAVLGRYSTKADCRR